MQMRHIIANSKQLWRERAALSYITECELNVLKNLVVLFRKCHTFLL